jgi:hypothetical protein
MTFILMLGVLHHWHEQNQYLITALILSCAFAGHISLANAIQVVMIATASVM